MPECFDVRGVDESWPLSYASGVDEDKHSGGKRGSCDCDKIGVIEWLVILCTIGAISEADESPSISAILLSTVPMVLFGSCFSEFCFIFGSDAPSGCRSDAYCSSPAIVMRQLRLGNELWLGVRDRPIDWRQSRHRGLGSRFTGSLQTLPGPATKRNAGSLNTLPASLSR